MSIKDQSSLFKLYYKLISYDKARFIVVGGAGFVANYIGLTILFHILGLDIVVSQIISAELAVIVTFLGNNLWTFKFDHHHSLANKLIRYHIGALVGIIINDLIVILLVDEAKLYYGLALVIGSLTALIWNYKIYKKIVFKPKMLNSKKAPGISS